MTETWKDIQGYEGIYQVSDLGKVRSLDRTDSAGRSRKGKELSGGTSNGYPYVGLCKDSQTLIIHIHRLVAVAFLGPAPNGMEINHKNGIKTDNRVGNLEYVTHKQNVRHANRNGLHGKLNKEQVQAIRYIYQRNRKYPYEAIASKFGVSETIIRLVVQARTFIHIPNIDGTPVINLSDSLSVKAVLTLRKAGFTLPEIGEVLSIDNSTTYRALNRAGISGSDV